MKKFFLLATALAVFGMVQAQEKKKGGELKARANDHLMLQIGYDGWSAKPDSIRTKGFSRSLNAYFMFDFPFKTDRRFSVGMGVGVGSSHIFFDRTGVEITGQTAELKFRNLDSSNRFKKYKLVSAYLEAPIELRFVADPMDSDHSFKVALGVKIGQLVNVHTRGKTLVNKANEVVNANVTKESSRKYFNNTRLAATARVGWGHISIFGQYQFNAFIREGQGPAIRPYSIGITLSGL